MKKFRIQVIACMMAGLSVLMSSCIGSFSLTNSVMDWNKTVGKKFLNEVVFVAFWIVPVYEVTAIADLLILNSIEFWSGKNPMDAYNQTTVQTESGIYDIKSDKNGYLITERNSGLSYRLNFDEKEQTWSIEKDGESYPFMTFIDENYVKMITPEGDFTIVELSEQGVMAYRAMAFGDNLPLMAMQN